MARPLGPSPQGRPQPFSGPFRIPIAPEPWRSVPGAVSAVAYVRRRNRRRWPRPGRWALVVLAGAAVLLVSLAVERALAPGLMAIAKREVEIRAVEAITAAIQEQLAGRYRPEDVVQVRYQGGRPVFVQVNTPLIVDVQARVLRAVQERLNGLRGSSVHIPLGAALGSELLAAWGPGIGVRMVPLGRVDVDVESQFQSAGINQVRHSVVLVVRTTMGVMIPLYGDTVPVQVSLPLVETVIPGEVPPWVAPWPGASSPSGSSSP